MSRAETLYLFVSCPAGVEPLLEQELREIAPKAGIEALRGGVSVHADAETAMRINLDAVKGVVTTMIQTEKYGTPLASALRVLSAEFRNERMMRAEEKAARLPAIMTVPLILFILPVLFIVILGPAACALSDAMSGGGFGRGGG